MSLTMACMPMSGAPNMTQLSSAAPCPPSLWGLSVLARFLSYVLSPPPAVCSANVREVSAHV